MRRILLVLLFAALTLPLLPTAVAAPPGGCGEYPGCHGVYVNEDSNGTCAGYVYPYRGHLGGCLDNDDGVCVIVGFEFGGSRRCTGPLALP